MSLTKCLADMLHKSALPSAGTEFSPIFVVCHVARPVTHPIHCISPSGINQLFMYARPPFANDTNTNSDVSFAGALSVIHKLWAMNFMLCLIAHISVRSGLSFQAFSRMLPGACVCSCGTRTRNLSAIVSLPCCKGLRHEHDPVLISQAG